MKIIQSTYTPLLFLGIEIFGKCRYFQLIRIVEIIVFKNGFQTVQHLIVGDVLKIHI